jgi:hypothetical protein
MDRRSLVDLLLGRLLFLIVLVYFARNARRKNRGGNRNPVHPKRPLQEIPSAHLLAIHELSAQTLNTQATT